MEGELGVRYHVCIPVTAPWSPGNIHLSIDIVEPNLGAAELSGVPPPGGDVDDAVACQGVLDPFIHERPPGEMISVYRMGRYCWEIIKITERGAREEQAQEQQRIARFCWIYQHVVDTLGTCFFALTFQSIQRSIDESSDAAVQSGH
jgi:hypothetical protein